MGRSGLNTRLSGAVRTPPLRRQVVAALAVILIAVAACSGGEVPDETSASGPGVDDPEELVRSWQFRLYPEADDREFGADRTVDDILPGPAGFLLLPDVGLYEPASGFDVRVVWVAGPCSHAPVLHVAGAAGQISSLIVDAGPVPATGNEEGGCADVAVRHSVDLATSASLADNAALILIEDGVTGSVEGVRYRVHSQAPHGRNTAPPYVLLSEPPSGWDLRVLWAASPCQRRPHLSLLGPRQAGGPEAVHVVSVAAGPHLVGPGPCDLLVWHEVDVRISHPVSDVVTARRQPASP
jgi:hypothetical protein